MPMTNPSGGGTPGGSTTQVQFNNAGAFAGDAGLTYDATPKALTIGGATVTTNNPALIVNQTVNAGGVAFTLAKFNLSSTSSAAATAIIDCQVGGASKLYVRKDGSIVVGTSILDMNADAFNMINQYGNAMLSFQGGQHPQISQSSTFRWTNSNTASGTGDTGLGKNAAGVVEVNNGTNGTFRDLKLRNLLAGGGKGSYVQTPSMTVANLAAAATAGAGARAFVTDATATTFLSTVAGGGANKVPVVSDGTDWLIG